MRILFVTNLPSPYRVDFFNEMSNYCELTVCFERRSALDRDERWKGTDKQTFRSIYADVKPYGQDKSIGRGILKVIKNEEFDFIIISGYASPSVMLAIAYCRLHKIKYYIETDGGFNKKDKFLIAQLKKFLLLKASGIFITCNELLSYYNDIGYRGSVFKYPFSSIYSNEVVEAVPSKEYKMALRKELGMTETNIVLGVGRFIYGKGWDVLINAMRNISNETGVYIVGGEPTAEMFDMKDKYHLKNLHFVEFMDKESLKKWYLASDCFVLPTRSDVWGLVINEAMSNGLPVITTDKCIAGVELIEDGENGYIVPVGESQCLAERINLILEDELLRQKISSQNIQKIRYWTIENMAKVHMEVFNKYEHKEEV